MIKKPDWLRKDFSTKSSSLPSLLRKNNLSTVCEHAHCPNKNECFEKKTATFLALGNICTRKCLFCNVGFHEAPLLPPDIDEPKNIAKCVQELKLRHVVITMVSRDDLPDQGSSHIALIIEEIRNQNPTTSVEVLTSDFSGDFCCLDKVLEKKPEIFNHNVETVASLTPLIRNKARYDLSLSILKYAKASSKSLFVKSGLMVGLGEKEEEVRQTIHNLFSAGCDIITIGQYLPPTEKHFPIKSFISPFEFKKYEKFGLSLGVKKMFCGPFVRSSYLAENFV